MNRITVHIITKDRPAEIAMLLESLRHQSFKDWDLIIVDESKTPIVNYHFVTNLINALRLEGHKLSLQRSEVPGVVANRNQSFRTEEAEFNNKYSVRIDDDSICNEEYLIRLFDVAEVDEKIGAVGGIVPLLGAPPICLATRNLKNGVFNHITWEDGKLKEIGDDGGMQWKDYLQHQNLFPSHHLRSSFLINNTAAKEVGYYDPAYQGSAWREETDLCLKLLKQGYKLYTDIGAICWHNRAPSGGLRTMSAEDYRQSIQILEEYFNKKWSEIYLKNQQFRDAFKKNEGN